MLINDLLDGVYQYVISARPQSDPTEQCFSQYRQVSGGRFLVSFREILNFERILGRRSVIKKNINF